MKFLILDLESTGLDPEYCQIIEIGAIAYEPGNIYEEYHTYVTHNKYIGQAPAFVMNSKILERIAKREKGFNYVEERYAFRNLESWVISVFGEEDIITLAGKNVGTCDLQMLKRLPKAKTYNNSICFGKNAISHRVFDPSILFLDIREDKAIPGLQECLNRAGINKTVPHTALDDCKLVKELVDKFYKLT